MAIQKKSLTGKSAASTVPATSPVKASASAPKSGKLETTSKINTGALKTTSRINTGSLKTTSRINTGALKTTSRVRIDQ